jgi:hypothetical protein
VPIDGSRAKKELRVQLKERLKDKQRERTVMWTHMLSGGEVDVRLLHRPSEPLENAVNGPASLARYSRNSF